MIQYYDIETTHGEIVVFVKEVKDNNFTLRSDAFYDDYLLVKGTDETTNSNFIELRSNIGFILLNVFENVKFITVFNNSIDTKTISKITNWIIENNN